MTDYCANGLMGYDTVRGEKYAPRDPCQRHREEGSIYCRPCRLEAGGYHREKNKCTPAKQP